MFDLCPRWPLFAASIGLLAACESTDGGSGGWGADARIGDCPTGHEPVVTSSKYTDLPCTKDGVFLGCAAPHGGPFHRDIASICDRPVFDPAYFYCLEGEENVAFYFSHAVDWCSASIGCEGVEVVTECDWNSASER